MPQCRVPNLNYNCFSFVRISNDHPLICDILFCRTGPVPPPPPSPNPDLGRRGSEGGDAGCGTVTGPSRPALVTESDSCTQNCEHFRNMEVEKLKGNASTCSLFGMAGTTPFRSPLTLFRAYSFRKEERLLNCVDHLLESKISIFSQGFLEYSMLLPDSWHDRDAILMLTSRG